MYIAAGSLVLFIILVVLYTFPIWAIWFDNLRNKMARKRKKNNL